MLYGSGASADTWDHNPNVAVKNLVELLRGKEVSYARTSLVAMAPKDLEVPPEFE